MTVNVIMLAYNHEAYIKEAITGVLIQQTDFDVDLIIADDASKDRTQEVVATLMQNESKVHIKYFRHSENVGMYANFMFACGHCLGDFVAICEGDDYWTDPFKLQKQVDFLETHPEFEVCFTNIKIIRADGTIKKEQLITDGRKDVYEQKDLPIWAPTLTRVFKNRDFYNKLPNAPGLDTVMLLYQSQFGKIKFIDEVTGVYRLHEGGVHSSNSVAEKKKRIFLTNLHSLELVPHYLMKRYFGMLLKKLTELRYLDLEEFSSCHDIFKCAFKKYHSELSFFLKLKIKLSLFLIKLPLLERIKILKTLILKFLNYSFIKMTYLKIGFL